ncbi:MAG: putative zinc-binding protein [Dehalococcoidia bacterium]|nr:putative zinc-binding protein [Dehalococcoidia bacterium]
MFACSGASNCRQVANSVVVGLVERGLGDMLCVADIGAHDKKIIESAMNAGSTIIVDGCGVACMRKILKYAGGTITKQLCITDYGVKKAHNRLTVLPEELENVMSRVKYALSIA